MDYAQILKSIRSEVYQATKFKTGSEILKKLDSVMKKVNQMNAREKELMTKIAALNKAEQERIRKMEEERKRKEEEERLRKLVYNLRNIALFFIIIICLIAFENILIQAEEEQKRKEEDERRQRAEFEARRKEEEAIQKKAEAERKKIEAELVRF